MVAAVIDDPEDWWRRLLAKEPVTSEEWEMALTRSDDMMRSVAAAHPDATPDGLRTLVADRTGHVRYAALQNPVCPADVVDGAMRSGSWHDARAVLIQPTADPALVSVRVHRALTTCEPTVPEDADRKLFLEHVSMYEHLPEHLHVRVAGSGRTKHYLRASWSTPAILQACLDAPVQGNGDPLYIPECVAQHPNATESMLRDLAKSRAARVKTWVAAHPHCPVDTLRALAKSRVADVKVCVAENAKCPVDLLDQLWHSGPRKVQEAVSKHPDCPEHLRVGTAFL